METKSKLFGAFQNSKKQQALQKTTSSVSKLIPLDSLNMALPTKS
jgi:hypothetical protein